MSPSSVLGRLPGNVTTYRVTKPGVCISNALITIRLATSFSLLLNSSSPLPSSPRRRKKKASSSASWSRASSTDQSRSQGHTWLPGDGDISLREGKDRKVARTAEFLFASPHCDRVQRPVVRRVTNIEFLEWCLPCQEASSLEVKILGLKLKQGQRK
ncbi:hypothetical protein VTL71DRAFT_6367, partial [Oculimacula yallundae]